MDGNFSGLLLLLKNRQNMTHLLPTSNITLTLLGHVQIYVSIRHLKK